MTLSNVLKQPRGLILLALMTLLPGTSLVAQDDADFREFLNLLNQHRLDSSTPENPIGILEPDAILTAASAWMANDMFTYNYVGLTDSQDRFVIERLMDFGYNGIGFGVFGSGYANVTEFFNALKNDVDDGPFILQSEFNAIGFGRMGTYFYADLGFIVQVPLGAPELTISGDFSAGITLTFTCQASYQYDIMTSSTLEPGSWTQVGFSFTPDPGDSPIIFLDNTSDGETQRFYRIEYGYVFLGGPPEFVTSKGTQSAKALRKVAKPTK